MPAQDGPQEGGRRVSTRNPRRRQRHDSDSLQHQPRRKRSKIATDTFEPAAALDGVRHGSVAANGHAEHLSRRSATPVDGLDVPVRTKKTTQKRAVKGDGSVVMTQNAHYSVKHLPSTPDIIRNSGSDFRGSILASPSYALALTREHAYVWDYTSTVPVTHPRSFDIPQAAKPTEPLPLGALVTNGPSTSIGLVIVSSTAGKVTFWENIDTAESLSLFQHRNAGVEGSLGSLFSGESAVELTSAEHAGFTVTLSSGRIAQISLRDAQGKPKVTAQFLKSTDSLNGGGLFSSLKGVLGVGWKRDIVGVRTRSHGLRGQIQIISATASAQIQSWDLTWSGHNSYRGMVDFRLLLDAASAKLEGGAAQVRQTNMKLADFAILPTAAKGNEVSVLGDDGPVDLLLLVQSGDSATPKYALVDVTLAGSSAQIERIIPLKSSPTSDASTKPSLVVPKPGHTAFVVFPKSVIIVSLVGSNEGPEAQLLGEANGNPGLFQDAVVLREDRHVSIQGCGEEVSGDKSGQSICTIFIKGFGVARLTANEPGGGTTAKVSVKSKIEQAIFYGTLPDNILDFSSQGAREYAQRDIEEATLAISAEILRSGSPYLPATGSSTEGQIDMRSKALRALVAHVKRQYGSISHPTCWKLLMDAEKLAVGKALWADYEYGTQKSSPKPSVLPAVVKMVRKQTRGIKISKESEFDELRHWFTHDLNHLDKLCYQTLYLVNNGYENNTLQNLMKVLSECDDILFAVFETVFAFRSDNAELYNLDPTLVPDGVLEQGWEELPEPWTATHEGLNLLDHFIDIARNYTVDLYEKPENQKDIDDLFVNKVVFENVRLVQILCRCYRERYAWCASHYAEKFREYAPGLADKFKRSREHHLRGLVKIGQAGAGIAIAERYRDMQSLVRLVISESAYLVESLAEMNTTQTERNTIQTRMDGLQANVERYFRIFGDEWATAFFDSHLTSHRSYGLLKEADLYQEPLTRYLRAEKARGRLGWINEVLSENNLVEAQQALTMLAREQETKLWNKKVELSLAKLMSLAVQEEKQSTTPSKPSEALMATENELLVISIQDALYRHLQPILYAAVDHDAEVQLVSDAYAVSIRHDLAALHQLLEIAFDDLLSHKVLPVEQLVDLLTLMDSVPSNDVDADMSGKEFHMAMQVLEAAKSSMGNAHFTTALRLVWKRCFLQDDWELINKTARKSDRVVKRQIKETTLCQTMVLALQSGMAFVEVGEVIGAGSFVEDLEHRFPSDDLRDPIIHDNGVQDARVQKSIEQNGLQRWYEACHEEAKHILDEEAEAVAAEEKAARDMVQSIAEHAASVPIASNHAKTNGNVKAAISLQDGNGDVEADGENGEYSGNGDGNGDVEMS